MDSDDMLREVGNQLIRRANAMAEQETMGMTLGQAAKQGLKDLLGIAFSQDLDFLTKLIIVLTFGSMVMMFIYLILPMSGRRKFEQMDFDPKVGGWLSVSGAFSALIFGLLMVTKMQKSGLSKSAE